MDKLKKLLELSSNRVDDSEIFYVKTTKDKVSFAANQLETLENSQSEGMALRVKKNSRTGFAYSTVIDEEVIKKTILNSEFGEKGDYDFSSYRAEPFSKDYVDKKIEKIDPDSFIDKGMKIVEEMNKFDNRLSIDISFLKSLQDVILLTSSGFSGEYRKNFYFQYICAQLVTENDIFKVSSAFSDTEHMEKGEKIIEDIFFFLAHGKDIIKIESGKYPVIFAPEALEALLNMFVASLKGFNIYRKTSPLHTELNRPVFDMRLTIYDDPSLSGVDNFLPFDDEGVPSEKITLVEKGILRNFLLDLKYGKELNMKSTGNSLRKTWINERNYYNYPDIYPRTIVMEPGNIPSNELIGNLEKGIFVKFATKLAMGSSQSGDFSGPLFLAYKIEKGKIKGRVKNILITGNIFDLMRDKLLEISSDRNFSWSSEYKVPYMLFKDVDITA